MRFFPPVGRFSFAALILGFTLALLTVLKVQGADPEEKPEPTLSPTPVETGENQIQGSSKVLVLHKPLLPAAWGQVIQYRRDAPHSLFDRDRKTLHEFVLRGPGGVIRIAFYHEPQDGAGFWEVWVWDQP